MESLKGLESLKDLRDEKFLAECVLVNSPEGSIEYRAMHSYWVQLRHKINEIEQSFGTLCVNGKYEDHLKQSKDFNIGE